MQAGNGETQKEITVRLRKAGWEVEITCSEPQLKQAIETVLASIQPAQPLLEEKGQNRTSLASKTCKGMILELWEDLWFASERSLSEVHEEIARRGHHYDKTAVSHALRELVIENILARQGNMRNYMYIQKHPPGSKKQADPDSDTTSEPAI